MSGAKMYTLTGLLDSSSDSNSAATFDQYTQHISTNQMPDKYNSKPSKRKSTCIKASEIEEVERLLAYMKKSALVGKTSVDNDDDNDDDMPSYSGCIVENTENILRRHKKASAAAESILAKKRGSSDGTTTAEAAGSPKVKKIKTTTPARPKKPKIQEEVAPPPPPSLPVSDDDDDTDNDDDDDDTFGTFNRSDSKRQPFKIKHGQTKSSVDADYANYNLVEQYALASTGGKRTKLCADTNPLAVAAAYVMKLSKPVIAAARCNNPELYAALTADDPKTMIHTACLNVKNHENIELLEWSEQVMIQLCMPRQLLDFKLMTWPIMMKLININKWSLSVLTVMQKCHAVNTDIQNIIVANRARKIANYPKRTFDDCTVFVTKPIQLNHAFIIQYHKSINTMQQCPTKKPGGILSLNRLLCPPKNRPNATTTSATASAAASVNVTSTDTTDSTTQKNENMNKP